MVSKYQNYKIAILTGQLSYFGGVGITAVNEVRELRKLGVSAELVVIFRKTTFDSEKIFQAEDIPIVFLSDYLPKLFRINFKFPFFSFFSFFHISSIFWAPFIVRKLKYNLIIVHETYNCFAAISSAKLNRVKLISYIWDPISYIVPRVYCKGILKSFVKPIKVFARFIDWLIIINSDLVFIGSKLHEKLLFSINSKKTYIRIPASTVVSKTIPIKRKDYIVALTKWDQGKKPEFLLELIRALENKVHLIIAGEWPDLKQKENFEKKILSEHLGEQVKVLGKVSEKEKVALFSSARMLVHPIVEAFGMFALEAAACGCPYILPKNSGVNELFIEGKHAYFPQEGDLEGFVKYVNILLTDRKKAYKMGFEAWKIAQNYSWQAHAKNILSGISQLPA